MSGVTKEDRIKVSADAWLESSTQISFDALPRIVDLDALPVLQKLGLIGVYWFVNHSDNNGALSCGQVYDLLFSLDVLRNEKLERAWPAHFHTDFVNMLQSCVDATVGFSFRLDEIDAPTPQQQHSQTPPQTLHSQTPQAQPPIMQNMGDVLYKLQNLLPAEQQLYNPAHPNG